MKTQTAPQKNGVLLNKNTSDPNISGPRIGTDDGISNRAMNVAIIIFMLLTVSIAVVAGAPSDDVKSRILLRQSMLDIEQLRYGDAVPKLMELMAKDPDNANVAYLLGICHLYGSSNYHQAAFYFDRASRSASEAYETWDLEERNAPVQTFYLMAVAWEKAGDYELAAQSYGKYLNHVTGGDIAKVSPRVAGLIKRNMAEAWQHASDLTDQTVAVIE